MPSVRIGKIPTVPIGKTLLIYLLSNAGIWVRHSIGRTYWFISIVTQAWQI